MVKISLAKINNLQTRFEVLGKSNVDKFATEVIDNLLKLAKNMGSDAHTFNKCYEVLSHSPCQSFHSELIVYKQLSTQSLNKLLSKARRGKSIVPWSKILGKDSRET